VLQDSHVNPLLDSLQQQHGQIHDLVHQVDTHLSASRLGEVGVALDRLRSALEKHLELEDRELYPNLSRLAEEKNQTGLSMTARMFSENMKRISTSMMAFFERYRGKAIPQDTFAREWKGIRDVLQVRFQSEESTLYPMYSRLTRN
jgi:regulator of sigma D